MLGCCHSIGVQLDKNPKIHQEAALLMSQHNSWKCLIFNWNYIPHEDIFKSQRQKKHFLGLFGKQNRWFGSEISDGFYLHFEVVFKLRLYFTFLVFFIDGLRERERKQRKDWPFLQVSFLKKVFFSPHLLSLESFPF